MTPASGAWGGEVTSLRPCCGVADRLVGVTQIIREPNRASRGPLIALVLGAAVALAAGAYGSVHDPAGQQTISLFFSNTLSFKAWMTSLIVLLAIFQLWSALRIWGRLKSPRELPGWFGDAHRLSGTLVFLLSLPVAFHCLWALGFESDISELRRFAHSLLGCVFYGAFAAKVTLVRSRSTPSWGLPVVGGIVFAALVLIWLTSSLWFFTTVAFPGV